MKRVLSIILSFVLLLLYMLTNYSINKRLENAFGVSVPDDVFARLTEEIQCAEQMAKEAALHE